jgi:hypothetical protein
MGCDTIGEKMSFATYCPRCWKKLNVTIQDSGNRGVTVATCPACFATFSEPEVEDIQVNIAAKRVPVVDALTAARMLGNAGKPEWVMGELREAVILHSGLYVIPLPSIRAYADREGIGVTPAASPTVWAEADRYVR